MELKGKTIFSKIQWNEKDLLYLKRKNNGLALLGENIASLRSVCSLRSHGEVASPRRFFGFFRRQFFLKGKIEKRRDKYPLLFNFKPFGIIR